MFLGRGHNTVLPNVGYTCSILCFLVLMSSGIEAQDKTIYKVVNEDGTVTYTDAPVNSPSATIFEVDRNTVNQSASLSPTSSPIAPLQSTEAHYPPLEIASPAPETTIRNNQGNISIRVKPVQNPSSPTYALVFDGQIVQKNSTGLFNLSGINRGAHSYHVLLLNNTGKTLASSPEQVLFLHKASVLINSN